MRFVMRGLTDTAFEAQFGTEAACLAALVAARQAAGMPSPSCDKPKSYVYGRRVGCTRCNERWSVTSGTVMADTKLPLTKWFRAMHLMTSTKQGISAPELGRIKATYKALSPKHLPDCLGAFCWTTNHRKNMPGMINAACRAIATSSAITRRAVYADLAGQIG